MSARWRFFSSSVPSMYNRHSFTPVLCARKSSSTDPRADGPCVMTNKNEWDCIALDCCRSHLRAMARASGSTEESGGGPVDAIDIMHDVVDDSALTAFSRRVGVWEHGAVFSGVHQHLIEQVLVPGTGVWTLRRALEEHLAVASPLEEGAGASVAGGGDGEGGAAADTPTPTPHVAAVAAVAAPPGTVPADAEAPSPGVHSPTLSIMPRTELVALQQGLAELCQPHTGSIETFLTETLADAVASLRACQVLPTRHDASDGGVGTSSHGPHAASTTDAPSSAGHQRFVALVRPMVRLVEALTCVASLCVSSARLVQVLEPLDEHSSFWKGRAEWPARDLLEAGPRWWWAAARRAVAAHRGGDAPSGDASRTRDSPSRRGVVGRSTTPTVATAATATSSGARRRRVGGAGGGQGAGASWRGAGNKRTSPTWYSAFDPTPAAVAKVKGIEQLRKPVLFRLGIVQRSLLAFRSATSASSIGVAVTRAVATLRVRCCRSFRFVSFRFVSFRFVSFRFVSFVVAVVVVFVLLLLLPLLFRLFCLSPLVTVQSSECDVLVSTCTMVGYRRSCCRPTRRDHALRVWWTTCLRCSQFRKIQMACFM